MRCNLISYVPQEDILINWKTISESLEKFWKVGMNFETLPNLKRRLLADQCKLWLWSNDDKTATYLFVTETRNTAMAKLFVVTHTAGFNHTDKPWTRKELAEIISSVFEEVEDLALTLYHDAVVINARPAHIKLAKGYRKMSQPIVKQLTKRGT